MLAERFSKEQFISTTARIIFVTDALGWVQERRLGYLKRYLPDITFLPMSAARFRILWNRGRLRDDYIYFATWRIPSGSVQAGDCSFEDADFDRFMTSVTSHYNIGGGPLEEPAMAQAPARPPTHRPGPDQPLARVPPTPPQQAQNRGCRMKHLFVIQQ